ncbi:YybS family protein [Lysinibacillus sp. 54212]|uniref:YybS family protein n=1 Tax=Lysinibacillus sp. 54212 TaxID=3119829 RepID=UPI002FCA9BCE
MPNNRTKAMVQGAIILGIFLILLVLAFYVPLVNLIAFVFAPLPIAWYSATYKRQQAISLSLLAVFASVLVGNISILPIAFVLAVIGFVIGDALRLRKSKVYLLLSTGLALLLTLAMLFLVLTRLLNIDVNDEGLKVSRETYEEYIDKSPQLMGQEVPKEQMLQVFDAMQLSVPAAITISVFILAVIIIEVNLPVLKRLQIPVPKYPPFSELRLPRAVLWYYLIVLSINLFFPPEIGTTLFVIVLNMSIVLWVLLTLQGISFIHYCIDAFSYPRFLKVIATILAIPLYSFIILLGIIDLGFNLREFIKGKSQK